MNLRQKGSFFPVNQVVFFAIAILTASNLSGIGEVLKHSDIEMESVVQVHLIKSPFQASKTSLRVLVPDGLNDNKRYPTLFILPVHEDGVFKHGDGLKELYALDVHDRHQVICVAPSFSSKPWYADHDMISTKRDESHFLRTVIPYIESHYPVKKDDNSRYLIGFSKSGWGAISLLLRHPGKFHKIVAWDPGIRMDMGPVGAIEDHESNINERFGSRENFENYRPSKLLIKQGKNLGPDPRLFYFNCDGVKRTSGGARLHNLMVREGIPHRYVMESLREHRWDSGWIPEAISFLFHFPFPQ